MATLSALTGAEKRVQGRFSQRLISFIELLCALMDKIPFSIVITGHLSGWKVFFYYLAIFSLISILNFSGRNRLHHHEHKLNDRHKRKIRKTRCLKIAALSGVLIVLFFLLFHQAVQKDLQLSFFDVDQGDGILIEFEQ